jgi:trk system potassium uptake protein TrkH
LSTATALFTLPLMFIGASPGSTGGGIKTVTFFILVGSVWSLVRGQGELDIFGRRIGVELLVRAGVVVTMSVLLVSAALLTLSVLEPEMDLLDLVFETVSAFGTVGLSRGVTADLTPPSQLVIIALMYLGRIGPLTFVIALMQKRREQHISYPAEEVLIG